MGRDYGFCKWNEREEIKFVEGMICGLAPGNQLYRLKRYQKNLQQRRRWDPGFKISELFAWVSGKIRELELGKD